MDRVWIELAGTFQIEDLRREAARERALAVLRREGDRWSPLVEAGRFLSRAGGRLEAIGRARPASTFVPVPCGGCAE